MAAAREALPRWQKLPALERGKYVFRIARLIQERARELAIVESLDGGKPIRESRDVDIPLAAAHFFYYAGWADKLRYGLAGRDVEPMGVVGQIVPWNFPLLMAAWKLAPALACGNTAVLKPAETTPLTALLLAEICRRPSCRRRCEHHPRRRRRPARRSSATRASTRSPSPARPSVGKDIQAALAGRDVGLTLELGGKSANIVFDDAAIDQAVEGIVNGIFFNQGHVCCAGSRLLLQESVAEEVIEKLWRRMGLLRVGDPLDKNTDVGAINWPSSCSGSRRWSTPASARERRGGRSPARCPSAATGSRRPCSPTSLPRQPDRRRRDLRPVVSVLTFRTQAEAIEKANATAYGLAAGVWTDKGSRALAVARGLKAGVVWQNTYNQFDPTSPFGGYKESGFGREGGAAGLRPYVRLA